MGWQVGSLRYEKSSRSIACFQFQFCFKCSGSGVNRALLLRNQHALDLSFSKTLEFLRKSTFIEQELQLATTIGIKLRFHSRINHQATRLQRATKNKINSSNQSNPEQFHSQLLTLSSNAAPSCRHRSPTGSCHNSNT